MDYGKRVFCRIAGNSSSSSSRNDLRAIEGSFLRHVRDKVDADVVGLQTEEGHVVRAQVAGRCGNNGYPFPGFDGGKHRVHIVQLIVQTRREAIVITGADNRIEDLRRACTLKGDDALSLRDPQCECALLSPCGSWEALRLAARGRAGVTHRTNCDRRKVDA